MDRAELLGALSVTKDASEPITSMKERLIGDLAHRAGLVLRDVRLVEKLRASRQPLLADQGLAEALQAQARKAAVPVEVRSDGIGRFPQEVEATAYFCCLEALHNAAKYVEASRVEITVTATDGQLRFEIADDGRGFDPATTPRRSGPQNMVDRLDAVGGAVEIRSAPGDGTRLLGKIPVGRVARA